MTDKPTVFEAWSDVMEEVRSVAKTDRNSQQGYEFRGIDAVINAVGPALRRHRVFVVPELQTANYRDVQTSTGKASRECTVTVTYRVYGPQGDSFPASTPGESMDFGDKGAPKAMSVALRIFFLQALSLPTHDRDPDAESYERAVGNGHAPPKLEPTAADHARKALRERREELGVTSGQVAEAWGKWHPGRDLATEADAEMVREFTGRLMNDRASLFTGPMPTDVENMQDRVIEGASA